MDDALRVGLWNCLTIIYWDRMEMSWLSEASVMQRLFQRLWHLYLKRPLDSLDDHWETSLREVRSYFFDASWNEVYDLLEFTLASYEGKAANAEFESLCNSVLEREASGYRFLAGLVTPITSEEELGAIDEAVARAGPWQPASAHLKRALDLLADRSAPDYRNSIKEAISAVEAACRVVAGEEGTLGQVLKKMEADVGLHPALQGAFAKLYGYTSDADGIRHALMEESSLSFADAKFMLVACSAFVNYLRVKVES